MVLADATDVFSGGVMTRGSFAVRLAAPLWHHRIVSVADSKRTETSGRETSAGARARTLCLSGHWRAATEAAWEQRPPVEPAQRSSALASACTTRKVRCDACEVQQQQLQLRSMRRPPRTGTCCFPHYSLPVTSWLPWTMGSPRRLRWAGTVGTAGASAAMATSCLATRRPSTRPT